MKRPTLTQPFANTKQLSKGGNSFTYIPAAEVIDRLDTVLGVGAWSFSCEAWRDASDPDWVIAHGRLEALGGTYEQFGGQEIKRFSSGDRKGKPIDLGDEFKGAASDALKKCCHAIGLGLYLALQRAPHMAAQFEDEQKGADRSAEDDGDQHSIGTVSGQGEGDTPRSPSPALTTHDIGVPTHIDGKPTALKGLGDG